MPVGVPLLSEIVLRDDSPDPRNMLRRRLALHALCNLGDKIKGFAKRCPPPSRPKSSTELLKETPVRQIPSGRPGHAMGSITSTKTSWPRQSTEGYRAHGSIVLARVASDQDQFLRELVAFAFNFWDGPLGRSHVAKAWPTTKGRGHWHDSSIQGPLARSF